MRTEDSGPGSIESPDPALYGNGGEPQRGLEELDTVGKGLRGRGWNQDGWLERAALPTAKIRRAVAAARHAWPGAYDRIGRQGFCANEGSIKRERTEELQRCGGHERENGWLIERSFD
jgi:hypothetical protein